MDDRDDKTATEKSAPPAPALSNKDDLIFAYCLDGKGGAKLLDWPEINRWTPAQGRLWINLRSVNNTSKTWLEHFSSISPYFRQILLDDNRHPSCIIGDRHLSLCLRSLTNPEKGQRLSFLTCNFYCSNDCLISIQNSPLQAANTLQRQFKKTHGPTTLQAVLLTICTHFNENLSTLIDDIQLQTDELERSVLKSNNNLLHANISRMRRRLNLLHRFLTPQRQVFFSLINSESKLFTEEQHNNLRSNFEYLTHQLEEMSALRDRCAITQDELNTKISYMLDQRMYLLSIITSLFLPITFITGLLGINVGGIPFAYNHHGFTIICGATLLIALFTLWLMRRHRWL